MAIAKRDIDLWGYVQRSFLEEAPEHPAEVSRTVRLVGAPVLALRDRDEAGWHSPVLARRGAARLHALERAVASGHPGRISRKRAAWLRAVQTDRVTSLQATALGQGLRLDPLGRGPVVDRPTVHYRDRLPWVLVPVDPYLDPALPDRAAALVDRWNATGEVFDRFYVADEPRTSTLPTHSLIGVVSSDGRAGHWFVLDRWAS